MDKFRRIRGAGNVPMTERNDIQSWHRFFPRLARFRFKFADPFLGPHFGPRRQDKCREVSKMDPFLGPPVSEFGGPVFRKPCPRGSAEQPVPKHIGIVENTPSRLWAKRPFETRATANKGTW